MKGAYDVVVVGGGPAGLATALAIHKVNPSWRLGVFERARELREIGASVGLLPNGQKALGSISAEALQVVKARGEQPGSLR
jgi:salicylate hydroxylase